MNSLSVTLLLTLSYTHMRPTKEAIKRFVEHWKVRVLNIGVRVSQKRRSHEMRSQVQDRRALEGMYASVYICPRVVPCALSDIISEHLYVPYYVPDDNKLSRPSRSISGWIFIIVIFFKKLKAVTIKFIPVSTIQVCHVVSSCSLKESVPFTYSSIWMYCIFVSLQERRPF